MPMDPHLAAALRHALGGALGWGAVGAGLGALGSEKGHRAQGALEGGLGGALTGGIFHGLHGFDSSMAGARRAQNQQRWADEAAQWEAQQKARHDEWSARSRARAEQARSRYTDPGDPSQWGGQGAKSRWDRAYEEAKARQARDDASSSWGPGSRSRAGAGSSRSYSTPPSGGALHDVAPWLKGVNTKADAKSAFRAQARANHPDVGGSTATMQNINQQWEQAQAHPDFSKLAALYTAGQLAAWERFTR